MRRILITGPESSGKSTLARDLAWSLDAVYIREYAREYLQASQGIYTSADLLAIWQGQAQLQNNWSSKHTLCCDTGPIVMYVWSMVKYQRVHPEIALAVQEMSYDHILLCSPDLPWRADPLRDAPDLTQRQALYAQYLQLVSDCGIPFTIISGTTHRTANALAALGH